MVGIIWYLSQADINDVAGALSENQELKKKLNEFYATQMELDRREARLQLERQELEQSIQLFQNMFSEHVASLASLSVESDAIRAGVPRSERDDLVDSQVLNSFITLPAIHILLLFYFPSTGIQLYFLRKIQLKLDWLYSIGRRLVIYTIQWYIYRTATWKTKGFKATANLSVCTAAIKSGHLFSSFQVTLLQSCPN